MKTTLAARICSILVVTTALILAAVCLKPEIVRA
jgi:hypothetical protein